jgi:hypothetical protein
LGLSRHGPVAQRRQTATNGGVPVAPPMLPSVRRAHRSGRLQATSKPAAQNQPSRRAPERCELRRGPGVATWTAASDEWTFTHGAGHPGTPRGPTITSGAYAPSTTALTTSRFGSQLTRPHRGLAPASDTQPRPAMPLGAAPARCCHRIGTTKRARSSQGENVRRCFTQR